MIDFVSPAARCRSVQVIDWLAVPQLKSPLIESTNVDGAATLFNAQWDLAWTSLK